jgi:hypothetical protein
LSAKYARPCSSTNTPPTGEQLHRAVDDLVQHRPQRFIGWLGYFDEFRRAVGESACLWLALAGFALKAALIVASPVRTLLRLPATA